MNWIHIKTGVSILVLLLLVGRTTFASPPNTLAKIARASAAAAPNWSVNPDDFEFNMNAVIRVSNLSVPSNAAGNIIGAFVGGELRGVATPVFVGSDAFFFLTIYANQYFGETVRFKIYLAADDAIYGALDAEEFIHNKNIGSAAAPRWLDINPNADLPPVLDPILSDTTLQTIPFDPITLGNYLFSADGDPISWSAQPGPNLGISLVNGVLTVSPISSAWVGTDSVRIIVTESTPNQLADTITAWFTVLPDYGAPVWQNIPGQTIFLGGQFSPFDLDSYLTFNGPCREFDFVVYPFTGSALDPAWPTVPPGAQPMSIFARPLFANAPLAGAGAKLAAFVNGNLAGWASPTGVAPNVSYNLQLANVGAGNITFKYYDAARQYLYEEITNLAYAAGGSIGSIASPYLIQLSPLVPTLAANGQFSITIEDSNWLGNFPIDFIVRDCDYPDQRNATRQAIFSVTADIRPEITSPSTINFEENACSTLYDAQTTDPSNSEGAGLSYSLDGGDDVSRFSIDAQTGVLSWALGFSPNFESPADANTDNQYEVNIKVTNAATLSDVLALTVTVTNQAQEPFAVSIAGGSLFCSNGTVNLQANGALSYVWSNSSTQPQISVSTPGTYTVTGTSTGSCTATATAVVSPQPSIAATGSDAPVCIGTFVFLSSAPSGGSLPYASFVWSGPNSFSANVEDPNSFTALPASAGTYTVTLTDAAGCSATATAAIAVSGNSAPSVLITANSPVCEGLSIVLSATPSGGTGTGYSYLWGGPDAYAAVGQNPPAIALATLAASGAYSVTLTDGAGCTAINTRIVSVKPKPTVVASSNSPLSVGSSILLNAAASGGSGPIGYTYQWSGPNSFFSTLASPTGFTASLGGAGVYTVTVTDGNGCTNTGSTTVNVVACPGITASVSGAVCDGGMVTLQSVPTSGALPYASFDWSGPNGYSANVEDPAAFAAGISADGTYTVKVTDNLGCTATATVVVTVNANPGITAQNNGPMCAGATALVSSTPSGGAPGYLFAWTGPDFFGASVEAPASFTSTAASSGVYQVKVTDSKGCTATATTTLVVNPIPTVSASSNSPLCLNADLNLQASATGSGTLGYNWAGPSFSSTQEDPTRGDVTAAEAGIYTLTVSDNLGCSSTATTIVSISGNNAPNVTASSSGPPCAGGQLTLSSMVTGGSTPYSGFVWSGPNSYSANVEDPQAFTVLSNASGVYSVTVTDNKNCKGTASVSVTVSAITLSPSSNSPICPGTNLQLNAGGPSGVGVNYIWTGPNGFSAMTANPSIPNATAAASGTYSVTVNDNGCLGNNSISVVVADIVKPDIACPNNTTIAANASCGGTVGTHSPVSVSDNCNPSPTVVQSPVASTALNGHNDVETVTLTASDGNGNTQTCSFTVTLKDATQPSISCPANTTVAANASCSGTVGAYTPTSVSDNCSPSPSIIQSPVASTALSGNNDMKTVTLTASDGNGNTQTCSFTVTLKDVTKPNITCPANATVAANASCSGVLGAYSPDAISDNCNPNPAVSQSPVASTALNGHNDARTVTLTANDGNGNTQTCSFTVTLKDATQPNIACPNNVTLTANASCSSLLGSYSPTSVSDNCNPSPAISQSPAASNVLSGHNAVQTVTLTANDGNGNTRTCQLTVTLKDLTKPSITCPANTTLAADAACGGVVGTYSPIAVSDNCNANPALSQNPAASTALNGHNDAETVTLTANDGNGNTQTCSFTVTLKDVTKPSITCPANTTLAADASCGGVVGTYSPTSVSDNCNANPAVTQSPAASTALSGHNDQETITLSASDGNGNTQTCSFTVTLKDVTLPGISCPANTTIAADASCGGTLGSYAPTAVSDNCNPNPAVSQSPAASTVLIGHNDVEVVTLTANDGNGNTQTCSFTVTLKDVTLPGISCPANTTIAANASCGGTLGTYAPATVSDNCNPSPAVTQNPAASTALNGHNDLETVTLTASDGNGNTQTCSFTVTLKDVTPPGISCPANTTIAADAACNGTLGSYAPTSVSDNCNPSPAVTQSPAASTGLSGHNDEETVTLTASDGNGNTQTCSFTVTLKDASKPTITCPANKTLLASTTCTGLLGSHTAQSVGDNCSSSVTVSQSPASTTLLSGHNDVETVTLTANDQNGNTQACTFTVTLLDQRRPTIACPSTKSIAADANCSSLLGTWSPASVSDNCTANPAVTQSPAASTILSGHNDSRTVVLTATDDAGNTRTCTFTVILKDQAIPVVICPANQTVNAGTPCQAPVGSYSPTTLSDNCTPAPPVEQVPHPSAMLVGEGASQVVTLTATDNAGNTAACTFLVTLHCQQLAEGFAGKISAQALNTIKTMPKVFPNPSRGGFTVEVPGWTPASSAVAFVLYNALGRQVLRREGNAQQEEFHLGEMPAGLYKLGVQHEGQWRFVTLILEE